MRNMIKKSLSKKFIIKGVATTLVVLLPFSFIKPKETQAIVGVDDAILFGILGLGAIATVGCVYGITKSGSLEKTSEQLSNSLQEFGNGFKTVNNNLAFAKSTIDLLPEILDAFESLEGTTYTEISESYLDENGYNCIDIPLYSEFNFYVPCVEINAFWGGGGITEQSNIFTPTSSTFKVYYEFNSQYNRDYQRIKNNGNFSYYWSRNENEVWTTNPYFKYKVVNGTTSTTQIEKQEEFPSIKDVTNPPTSISLDKDFVEDVATTYAEQNPNDNNGDKEVDYATLIPLFFQLLEKKLGDGTITPSVDGGVITPLNLTNNGISSYVYKDGTIQGQNPYNFQDLGDNNINVEQNVNINNGSEISEEEKNGILNILDNGVRKTTILLNNLKNSMTGLGDTLQGLFNFLPEPVGYLFYSALCLSLIFFILSLRR